MSVLQCKRIYEPASDDDGYRVLVDRLWPRGVSKEKAHLDLWLKEIAPSTELRKWWGHDPDTADEFTRKYRAELRKNPAVEELAQVIEDHPKVTLLYSAHDEHLNQAEVLRQYMTEQIPNTQ